MDAYRSHKTPGSETKEFITHNTASSMSFLFSLAPLTSSLHGAMGQDPGRCLQLGNPELRKPLSFLLDCKQTCFLFWREIVVFWGSLLENILDILIQNKISSVSAQKMCRDELSPKNTGQYLMLPLEKSTVTCKDFYQGSRNRWKLVYSVNSITTPVS